MTQHLKAVLFDFDDTLVPEIQPERAALLAACETAAEHGVNPADLAERLRHHSFRLWGEWGMAGHYANIGYSYWEGLWGPYDIEDKGLGDLHRWMPDYRERSWRLAFADLGVEDPALADQVIERYRTERVERLRPYPESVQVLEDLCRRYEMALVTNGSPAVQRSKLEQSGLGRFFPVVAVSGAVGVGKPDRKVFMSALDQLGVAPEHTAMVGNSLSRDIAGALNLGIHAVWVNRNGETAPEGMEPDQEVKELTELLEFL